MTIAKEIFFVLAILTMLSIVVACRSPHKKDDDREYDIPDDLPSETGEPTQ